MHSSHERQCATELGCTVKLTVTFPHSFSSEDNYFVRDLLRILNTSSMRCVLLLLLLQEQGANENQHCAFRKISNISWIFLKVLQYVWKRGANHVFKKFKMFFIKIYYISHVLDRLDMLISKIIFEKWKNIIDMHFSMKSYLKSNHNHTTKYILNVRVFSKIKIHFLKVYKIFNGRVKRKKN